MSETPLARAIRDALTAIGVYCWRANAGGYSRRMRGAPAGTPDIIGFLVGGKMLALEVKAPGGKERPAQTEWLAHARAAGCIVGVVRSPQEAVDLVRLHGKAGS